MRDHVLNFIIAGRDTTAQALSWCTWLLTLHPEIADKIKKESEEVLGDQLYPDYENVKQLKYAQAVFYETLRLYPSVPGNSRCSKTEVSKHSWKYKFTGFLGLASKWCEDSS